MGTKNEPGRYDCYAAAEPDEPMFVLLARDPLAPIVVRLWAMLREREHGQGGDDAAKQREAFALADAMGQWRMRRGMR